MKILIEFVVIGNIIVLLLFHQQTWQLAKTSELYNLLQDLISQQEQTSYQQIDTYYCQEVDNDQLQNNTSQFDQIYVVTNFTDVPKNAIKSMGGIVYPEKYYTEALGYPTDTNIIFMNHFDQIHVSKTCIFQMLNKNPGRCILKFKDNIPVYLGQYEQRYFHNRSECFDINKIIPKSFSMDNKNQCVSFFNLINNESFNQSYLIKYNSFGGGQGVKLLDNNLRKKLNKQYQNGSLCGKIITQKVAQKLIQPILYKGRKFDFRVFVLISSSNPLIAYYHDGYVRVALPKYNLSSDSMDSVLTNTGIAEKILANLTEDKKLLYQSDMVSTFGQIQDYLVETGKVSSDWIEKELRPQFKKALSHFLTIEQEYLTKDSRFFQLLGLDFIMDEDLKIWFLEANTAPGLQQSSPQEGVLMTKLVQEIIQVQLAYIKSKFQRIKQFLNITLTLKNQGIYNKTEILFQFNNISKNYLEQEFLQDVKETDFQLIIDSNLGADAYNKILEEQCIPKY